MLYTSKKRKKSSLLRRSTKPRCLLQPDRQTVQETLLHCLTNKRQIYLCVFVYVSMCFQSIWCQTDWWSWSLIILSTLRASGSSLLNSSKLWQRLGSRPSVYLLTTRPELNVCQSWTDTPKVTERMSNVWIGLILSSIITSINQITNILLHSTIRLE